MNHYKIKTSCWDGSVTIRAKNQDILYDVAEHYQAIGYEIIKDKKGREITPSHWSGNLRMRLECPKGQLEQRLQTKWSDVL